MVGHHCNVFAHPATESLTYWGLADEGEWWMKPTTALTDDAGRVVIDGIAGMYAVSVGGVSAAVDASAAGSRDVTVTIG